MFIKFVHFLCLPALLWTGFLAAERTVLFVDLDKKQNPQVKKFRKCDLIAASGSSQFSEDGLQYIINELSGKKIACVDLRQEPHGFKGRTPISWKKGTAWAYGGALHDEIEAHQKKRLEKMLRQQKVKYIATERSIKARIKRVCTEQELCERYNVAYIRVPIKDHHHPSDAEVKRFISFVQGQADDTWFHFHCFAGIGRTTVFLVMYDCMKTAKQHTLEEIQARQIAIGGIDLLHTPVDLSTWPKNESDRKAFLIKFHEYCKNNTDNFHTPFQS